MKCRLRPRCEWNVPWTPGELPLIPVMRNLIEGSNLQTLFPHSYATAFTAYAIYSLARTKAAMTLTTRRTCNTATDVGTEAPEA